MAKKIEALTPEQEARLPEIRDKWIAVGLNTEPNMPIAGVIDIMREFKKTFKVAGTNAPVIYTASPKQAWRVVCVLSATPEKAAPFLALANDDDPDDERNELIVQGLLNLYNKEEHGISVVWPWLTGSFSASVLMSYDYWCHEVPLDIPEQVVKDFDVWKRTKDLGIIYPIEEATVVSKRPIKIERNERGLHCETGKALEYEDGWGVYSLHGVRVPAYLVETPAEELSVDWYTKQTNADIQAEFIRKAGVERLLDRGRLVDSFRDYPDNEENRWIHKSEYELWDLAALFPWLSYQPYLKMKNQTTGVWHVEACSPEVRSVKDAIRERHDGRDVTILHIA